MRWLENAVLSCPFLFDCFILEFGDENDNNRDKYWNPIRNKIINKKLTTVNITSDAHYHMEQYCESRPIKFIQTGLVKKKSKLSKSWEKLYKYESVMCHSFQLFSMIIEPGRSGTKRSHSWWDETHQADGKRTGEYYKSIKRVCKS